MQRGNARGGHFLRIDALNSITNTDMINTHLEVMERNRNRGVDCGNSLHMIMPNTQSTHAANKLCKPALSPWIPIYDHNTQETDKRVTLYSSAHGRHYCYENAHLLSGSASMVPSTHVYVLTVTCIVLRVAMPRMSSAKSVTLVLVYYII